MKTFGKLGGTAYSAWVLLKTMRKTEEKSRGLQAVWLSYQMIRGIVFAGSTLLSVTLIFMLVRKVL